MKPTPEVTEQMYNDLPDVLFVKSTVRSPHTRALRAASPGRTGLNHYLDGGVHRLTRGRPVELTKTRFFQIFDELRDKASKGILKVYTRDGREVNLDTLVIGLMPAPVGQPMPPMDSIANDKPSGLPLPIFDGGDPALLLNPSKLPELLSSAPSALSAMPSASEGAQAETSGPVVAPMFPGDGESLSAPAPGALPSDITSEELADGASVIPPQLQEGEMPSLMKSGKRPKNR